jgi:hypothetical protein
VPLALDVPGPAQEVSILRAPGQPPEYTMQIGTAGLIRITPNPERAGPSTVTVDVFDQIESELSVRKLVLTTAAGDGPTRQVPTRRLDVNRFSARVTLARGRNTISVVAHALEGGQRLRGVFDLKVP